MNTVTMHRLVGSDELSAICHSTSQAQSLLLVSADLLFHSPSYINITQFLEPDQSVAGAHRALEFGERELSGLISSARVQKEAALLRWMLNAMECVRAQADGFEAPTAADIHERLGEVTASLLHEHTMRAFSGSFNAALRRSGAVGLP